MKQFYVYILVSSEQYHSDVHTHVAAAILCVSGNVYTGRCLECSIGSLARCAEKIAIGEVIKKPEEKIETIVAVHGKCQ